MQTRSIGLYFNIGDRETPLALEKIVIVLLHDTRARSERIRDPHGCRRS
jgi:hypothetical protein